MVWLRYAQDVGIAKIGGVNFHRVRSVVDVWADHSIFPESVLNELGIEPGSTLTVALPDGGLADWGYGMALLDIDGQQWPCPVVFGPDNRFRLGASALQIFNLAEDYAAGTLAPASPLSLGKPVSLDAGSSSAEFAMPTSVAPREGYRIWLRYADGVSGEVDLSELADAEPFAQWCDRGFFESVRLGVGGSVAWGDDIALCGDDLYLKLSGKNRLGRGKARHARSMPN